ncbi:MAG TPA: hypothetical protein VGB83_04730 [Actinomycetota bacterium]
MRRSISALALVAAVLPAMSPAASQAGANDCTIFAFFVTGAYVGELGGTGATGGQSYNPGALGCLTTENDVPQNTHMIPLGTGGIQPRFVATSDQGESVIVEIRDGGLGISIKGEITLTKTSGSGSQWIYDYEEAEGATNRIKFNADASGCFKLVKPGSPHSAVYKTWDYYTGDSTGGSPCPAFTG